MKISESWLREWVNPPVSTSELVHILTMAGLEVDSTQAASNEFTGVVIGEVISVTKHPEADKLNICSVSDGNEHFQVVCGAPNVRQGLKVPFAKIGAVLSADFKIKRARLRGVESNGMLCSAEELGLAESADGLLELPMDSPTGADIREFLDLEDTLIEIDLTPNRGDCLSIAGIAREVAVLTNTPLNRPQFAVVDATINDKLDITLTAEQGCPRYLGRVIRDINQNVETPLWMQEKLRRCGLRSIDPVVDVTNFVLIELGQPMHAFDFDRIDGHINVRQAAEDEKLTLLDGKQINLDPGIMVISDKGSALAIAGIMGGKASAVNSGTRNIFLESAFFSPLAIAGRARGLGLHTDAAHRYERGVDYELPSVAMERATALLLEIVGGQAGPVVESIRTLPVIAPVSLRNSRINGLLGVDIPQPEISRILASLGFKKAATQDQYLVPSWRFDINIEADLIEELARVYGYDKLPVKRPLTRLGLREAPEGQLSLKTLRRTLVALGYQEVVTYSFVDQDLDASLSESVTPPVALANPISRDMNVMRSTVWPGLIKTLKHNQNRQLERCRLFESGLTFVNKNNKIEQKVKVSSLIWGAVMPEQWSAAMQAVDFFDLKGDLETLIGLTHNAADFSFKAGQHPALQPGQTARLFRGEKAIGWLGALHPNLTQALDINGKVLLAEIDFESLQEVKIPVTQELSRFPTVRRDLAFVLDKNISAAQITNVLKAEAGDALIELTIFDLYQGQNIEKDKKSLALGLTFQHASRTLTDLEINPIIDNCINALRTKFKAELR